MRLVIQRVKSASVKINNEIYSEINEGLLIYLGIHENDSVEDAISLANKVSKLRIFEDKDSKMNLDIKAINGEFLVVSQFTLYGNTNKGNRPSFIEAARPEKAIPLYNAFIKELKNEFTVKQGEFGAHMLIESINDGPVTIIIN